MTKKIIIDEALLRRSYFETQSALQYHDHEKLINSMGGFTAKDACQTANEAVLYGFSVPAAMMKRLNGDFAETRNRAYSALLALYLGSAEAYEKLVAGNGGGTLTMTEPPLHLQQFYLDTNKGFGEQRNQLLNLLTSHLKKQKRSNCNDPVSAVRDYFGFVRDYTLSLLKDPSNMGNYQVAAGFDFNIAGKSRTLEQVVAGKSSPRDTGQKDLKWDRFIGYDEQKAFFQDIELDIKDPATTYLFTQRKDEIASNVLLVGPPGTGKTTLCRTFANESSLPCVEINIGDVADRFQDGPVERLKQSFESALEPIRSGTHEYSVLIIDEIEAITNVKATGDNNGSALRQIKLFDTYAGDGNQTPGLIIAATTNYMDLLPGTVIDRFEILDMPRPDNQTLKALLQYFTQERQSEAQIQIFNSLDLNRITAACRFSDGKNFVARNVKMMVKGMIKEMRRNYRRGLEHIVDTDSFVRKARAFAHSREGNNRESSY